MAKKKKKAIVNEDISTEQLKQFAKEAIISGKPLTRSGWTGPGMPFTVAEYHNLVQLLLRHGWIEQQKGHLQITPNGDQALRNIIGED